MQKIISGSWAALVMGVFIACAACAQPVSPPEAPVKEQALFFYEFYSPM